MAERPRLVMFPGLGADERLFGPQRALDVELEIPRWIPPAGPDESLHAYARRLAATIRTRRPYFLGGISFGGMLALETARVVGKDACLGVILVSSCRSRTALPWAARIGRPLAAWIPAHAIHAAKSLTCPARWLFGAATREQVRLFNAMLRDTPPGFLKWSLRRATDGPTAEEVGVPVRQIHGSRDRVIPCPRAAHRVEIVDGAGHLMSWTHHDQVNAFIHRAMAR